ncbi:MAG: 3-isopropylmalate dehydrogenase [Fibrobacteria bacterium]|nr:3-isopropylmalate dehydrogenase [Fibrobacteria bacterium]
MQVYKIAVMPGDGTGPEVVNEAVKVLHAVAAKQGFKVETQNFDFGAERYLKTGELLPDEGLKDLEGFDSIILGAIGHPSVKPGILEVGILLKARFYFDQYINLRPVKLYPNVWTPLKDKGPKDIDFVIIRENTGGLYTGMGGASMVGTQYEIATQQMTYSRPIVERCMRYAFEYTKKRNKDNTLTLSQKCNVLTHVGDLWVRTHEEVGAEYPDIKRDYNHVDATTMWMVKNPEWYDVIVTSNMFGDIITDLGAMIQGGMGIAAGGNINPEGVSMFEPIGGSAPKYEGQNVINPLASISSIEMLLNTLGEEEGAKLIDKAIYQVLESGQIKSMAAGHMGMSTSEVGDLIADIITKM